MKNQPLKRYTYEEWVEFTRLIRFSRFDKVDGEDVEPDKQLEYDEAVDGVIEWDWLDSKSPMTSEQAEPEWVLDRLLESLLRSFRKGVSLPRLETSSTIPEASNAEPEAKEDSTTPTQPVFRRFSFAGISENADEPQWSKRGKARINEGGAGNYDPSAVLPKETFRPASGFHGRLKGVIK